MILHWLNKDERSDVKQFYRRHMPYARLLSKESICILKHTNNQIIASARIRPIGQLAILTGILVHPDFRHQGLAHRLMNLLEHKLGDSTYLFARAPLLHFYKQHGFTQIESAPNDIMQLYQKYQGSDSELILMGPIFPAKK